MDTPTPPSRWQRWRSHLLTVALVLAVFLGVQAWQTRAVPAVLDLNQPVQWLGADGSSHSGSLAQALVAARLVQPQTPARGRWRSTSGLSGAPSAAAWRAA